MNERVVVGKGGPGEGASGEAPLTAPHQLPAMRCQGQSKERSRQAKQRAASRGAAAPVKGGLAAFTGRPRVPTGPPTMREVHVGGVAAVLHEGEEVDIQVPDVPVGKSGGTVRKPLSMGVWGGGVGSLLPGISEHAWSAANLEAKRCTVLILGI